MEIEQFVQFRIAAQYNHLGRAADALNMTQPALSQTIRRLEQRYGLQLFDRVGRTIKLNANGQVLLEHVERTLRAFDDASRAMRTLAGSHRDSIALGYFGVGGRTAKPIPYLIGQFQECNSVVDFSLLRTSNDRLFERLKDGSLDLCFTSRASTGSGIVSKLLWHEELFVHVSCQHRFATRSEVDLPELSKDPAVCLQEGSDLRAITDVLYKKAGYSPHVVFEGHNILALQGVVAANMGVALAPELDISGKGGVIALTVRTPKCFRPIYVSWIRERQLPKIAIQFQDFVLSNRTNVQSIGFLAW